MEDLGSLPVISVYQLDCGGQLVLPSFHSTKTSFPILHVGSVA